MQHLRRILPTLLGVGFVAAVFGRLADPGVVLAVRDLPLFHLPLRTAFAKLASSGLPLWNPWIHGGQPILSNPNYAVFYPPTWVGLLLPPAAAINLLILVHAGWAFAGAWSLAGRLGLGRPARAFAAVAFVGGGVFASSPNTLNLFCALAWMPWVLRWGDEALRAGRESPARSATILTAAGLAAQLLAGEPVMVLVTGLALGCLALDAACDRTAGSKARLVPRLAAVAGWSAILAAAQLVPTLVRLRGSARLADLAADPTLSWSMPPRRLAEWLLPTLFGDPMLAERNLFFGYGLHDRDYPYLISIYCGQAILVLAVSALLRWPIRRRIAWAAMAVLGVALALGRLNPVYSGLLAGLPPFSLVRYPEKFLILANAGLAFAAAAGWDHLLERRRADRPKTVDQALALALVAAGLCALFLALLVARPDAVEWLMSSNSPLPRSPEVQAAGLAYLRSRALTALAIALATSLVLAGHRSRRIPAKLLVVALLAVTATDLWLHTRTLHPVARVAGLLDPPPVARAVPSGPGRIFSDEGFYLGATEVLLLNPEEAMPSRLRAALDRLDPYAGNLWGLSYALHEDYDLMLTGWARHGLEVFHRSVREQGLAGPGTLRLLGAWGVGNLLVRRSMEEVAADWRAGDRRPPRVRVLGNPHRQPLLRPFASVRFVGDAETAARAAGDTGFDPASGVWWIDRAAPTGGDPPAPPEPSGPPPVVVGADIRASRIAIDYEAPAGGYLEVAVTWDQGWSARASGRKIPVRPTALGQMGLELPSGAGTVELAFRERWLPVGAGVSLIGLIASLLLTRRRRSRTTR